MADFATVDELAAGWRTLTTAEQNIAAVLLARASRKIRARRSDIDARIADGTLDAALVADVACAMVKRAMLTSAQPDGVTATTDTSGPFTQAFTYANPLGNLYLSKDDKQDLGIGSRTAFAVDLGPAEHRAADAEWS